MGRKPTSIEQLIPVHYHPPAGYALDLEIFPLSEFRRRVSVEHLRQSQRVDFHMLLYVTQGRCTHIVDFEPLACERGTLLVLNPGQMQRFDTKSTDWEGWLVIFRPEFLPARVSTTVIGQHNAPHQLADLSVHRTLSVSEQEAVTEGIERMAADARLHANANVLHPLLRHQLLALLFRLHLIWAKAEPAAAPVLLQRFRRYRLAVEDELHHLHQVADYAKLIGCSQKSLQRATLDVAGVSAKAFLSQRIVLEAKRLLAHSGQSVSDIADKLGFDEATNFVKFFRREAGMAPGDFRRQHTVG
ncbi:helix-turn-helix domain-containing protein [Herminiimonas sp. NPDC097707]|uniref:AraC family transcriptional regulator n=1 Tax=Herminiimonas sp. NPDC097707 TaxID=3364007 RepID=UPI00383AC38A